MNITLHSKNYIYNTILLLLLLLALHPQSQAQNVDLGNLKDNFAKDKIIKINGGLNTNLTTYSGGTESGRDPYTWLIGGNLNVMLFNKINLPFSLNLTNAGSNLKLPTSPNRISLNPTYKWVSAHIGSVNMTFSPYTLNGHQFSGAGVDLTPKGGLKFSAMYGRFQKAVETDYINNIPASYKRMGYGAKISYEKKGYTIGMTVFSAKDIINSLAIKPDSQQIYPEQNLVTSWNLALRPLKGIEFTSEYAISALTKDLRDTTEAVVKSNNILSSVIDARNSTSYSKALKLQVNYNIKKTIIGFGYERIDPGFRTLGAYFFANDLEKFTMNMSKVLFNNKVNVAANIGIQKDDLDGEKSGTNSRYIGSVNINYNPNQKITLSVNYSNFQTYMNIKQQFQYINQLNQLQNLDTFNYKQISQNANFNMNYLLQSTKTKTQSINLNGSMQDAYDKQGNVINTNGSSKFYNGALLYNILFLPSSFGISAAYNLTYNTIATDNYTTLGPTLVVNSKWFHKKLNTSITTSYNTSSSSNTLVSKSSVINLRFNARYIIKKKHNLSMSIMNQTIRVEAKKQVNNLIGNIGYSFNF